MTASSICDRYIGFDHCRLLLPIFRWARENSTTARLHRLALEISRPGALVAGSASRILAGALFLASGLRQIAIAYWLHSAATLHLHGVPRLRQLRGLFETVFRRNAAPQFYYVHRAFRPGDLARLQLFLEHRETQLLLATLHASLDVSRLSDKLRFHDFCHECALPTVPLWAVFADGSAIPARSAPWLADPQADCFVKPATDYAGHGVVRWCHDAATRCYTDGCLARTHAELTAALAGASTNGPRQLVQPRLHEGAALADLATGAVCNYRVLTGRAPEGAPVILTTVLRLPSQGHYLTDVNNDIFAAPIDPATGILGPAQCKDLRRGTHARHPVTGALIAGRRIPNWAEIEALARRAHAACPWMPFVGWDIVDSVDGPLLLEANTYWGANLAQMAGHRFLGETEFPAIYLAHLARLRPELAARVS